MNELKRLRSQLSDWEDYINKKNYTGLMQDICMDERHRMIEQITAIQIRDYVR